MSESSENRLAELLEEARWMEKGPARLALTEEAIRLADSLLDEEAGFEARQLLIETATFIGRPDLTLVAFAWCLAVCDRNPESYNESRLLWEYKWVVGMLSGFPAVSRAQIDATIADMEARFCRAGSGIKAALKLRYRLALEMGDFTQAAHWHSRWEIAPNDRLTDCPACELDDEVGYLIATGDDAGAVDRAGPILKGRLKCAEVPHVTLARLVLPLFRLGRDEQAMECHLRGYRLVAHNSEEFVESIGSHLTFAALTGNLDHGVRMLEKHLPQATVLPNRLKAFHFLLSAVTLLGRLREMGVAEVSLRLPKDHPAHRPDGRYPVPELLTAFEVETGRLADVFDARHGNGHFRSRLAAVPELLATARVVPLPTAESARRPSPPPSPGGAKGDKNSKW